MNNDDLTQPTPSNPLFGPTLVRQIELPEDSADPAANRREAVRQFQEYVVRFEELYQKYQDDPDAYQKIAQEMNLQILDDADVSQPPSNRA
jgi:hypothetical protein